MATDLTLNNKTFAYPDPGDGPGWGEDGTNWAIEATIVLNSLFSSDDIAETTFTVANTNGTYPTATGATNVTGLNFSDSTVRAAFVRYSVYRRDDSSDAAEAGIMFIVYQDDAATGSKFQLTREGVGDAGINFFITDTGQVTYTSSTFSGTNYAGTMKFQASTLAQ